MVCPRCILVVQRELDDLHISSAKVELGFAEFEKDLSYEQLKAIEQRLVVLGFEILKDNKNKRVKK